MSETPEPEADTAPDGITVAPPSIDTEEVSDNWDEADDIDYIPEDEINEPDFQPEQDDV